METVAETPIVQPHIGFKDKMRLLLACVVSVLLIAGVGWRVGEPADSQMAATFVFSGRSVMAIWPAMVVLALVSASIATAIAGRRLPEAGILATGVGLGGMALRGGSMQMILVYHGVPELATRRSLMMSMAWDCVLWTSVMAAAWVATVIVRRWLWNSEEAEAVVSSSSSAVPAASLPRQGWLAMIVSVVVSVFVIWLTIARTPVADIARGQVVASVVAGLFLGCMAGRYFTGVDDARWYGLAAPVSGLIGYLLGYLNAGMGWAKGEYAPYAELMTTPFHALARPLPIEFVAIGVAAAIAGFWSGERMEHVAEEAVGK